mgnify:CR=1 FL=1
MKKIIAMPLLALTLLAAFSACQKQEVKNEEGCFIHEDPSVDQTIATPETFSDQIPAAFEAIEIMGGTETEAFFIENEGIPSFLEEAPLEADELQGKREGKCDLRGDHALTPEQKAKLIAAWKDYQKCRELATMKLRAAHREMMAKFEKRRMELVQALRAKKISESEFKAAMEKLRKEFRIARLKHGKQHHEVIRHCYKGFLEKLERILTKEQYRIFMRCHQQRLPQTR